MGRFLMGSLVIGFFSTIIVAFYNYTNEPMTTLLQTGMISNIGYQVYTICYYAIAPYAMLALIFFAVQQILTANARAEMRIVEPITMDGFLVCGICICAAMFANFALTAAGDPMVMITSTYLAIPEDSYLNVTDWLSRMFNFAHLCFVFLIVIGYIYMAMVSMKVESLEGTYG
jgi:hypothetical protein